MVQTGFAVDLAPKTTFMLNRFGRIAILRCYDETKLRHKQSKSNVRFGRKLNSFGPNFNGTQASISMGSSG